MRKALIAAVVLLVLAVVGDRVAEQVAEGKVASVVQERENLSSGPEVEFKGFPFLTQVLGNEIDEVEMRLPTVDRRGADPASVGVADVEVTFFGVHTSDGFSQATADTMTGSGFVPYETVNEIGDVRVAYAGEKDGVGAVSLTSEALGVDTSITVGVDVRDGAVRFTGPGGGGRGSMPRDLRPLVEPFIAQRYPVFGLPAGFTIESLEATPEGLELGLSAEGVRLAG